MNYEKVLELLKKLNQLSDFDNLPKELLKKISYTDLHGGVTVSLQYEGDDLLFVFNMSNGPDADDVAWMSIDEVEEIMK